MDEQEIAEVRVAVLKALAQELKKVDKRQIKKALTWDALAEVVEDAANGGRLEEDFVPDVAAASAPVMLPEHPKLKVRWDAAGQAQEWIVVNNFAEEAPYQAGGWYTQWPPNSLLQLQGKAGSLESEIGKFRAAGVKERAKEDWQRKQAAAKK